MPICCSIRARILRAALLVLGMPPQHVQQGVDGIGMAPVVVKGVGRIAADLGQVLHQPGLGPIEGPLDLGAVAADLQQGRNAERSHRAAKRLMGAGHGGINLLGPAAPLGTPRAVGVLPLEQEGHAAADRGLDLLWDRPWAPAWAWDRSRPAKAALRRLTCGRAGATTAIAARPTVESRRTATPQSLTTVRNSAHATLTSCTRHSSLGFSSRISSPSASPWSTSTCLSFRWPSVTTRFCGLPSLPCK